MDNKSPFGYFVRFNKVDQTLLIKKYIGQKKSRLLFNNRLSISSCTYQIC